MLFPPKLTCSVPPNPPIINKRSAHPVLSLCRLPSIFWYREHCILTVPRLDTCSSYLLSDDLCFPSPPSLPFLSPNLHWFATLHKPSQRRKMEGRANYITPKVHDFAEEEYNTGTWSRPSFYIFSSEASKGNHRYEYRTTLSPFLFFLSFLYPCAVLAM